MNISPQKRIRLSNPNQPQYSSITLAKCFLMHGQHVLAASLEHFSPVVVVIIVVVVFAFL